MNEFMYYGSPVAQTPKVIRLLELFHNNIKYHSPMKYRIIEIGTFFGGFSKIIVDSSLRGLSKSIETYDIIEQNYNDDGRYGEHLSLFIYDVFDPLVIDKLSIALSGGPSIVFCDGGDKIKEINTFYKMINGGSFILAHDYDRDGLTLESEINDWVCCEIKESDIECEGAIDFMPEEFNKCGWTCKMKPMC